MRAEVDAAADSWYFMALRPVHVRTDAFMFSPLPHIPESEELRPRTPPLGKTGAPYL